MPDPKHISEVFDELADLNMLGGLGDDRDEFGVDRDELDEADREDWEAEEYQTVSRRPRRRLW